MKSVIVMITLKALSLLMLGLAYVILNRSLMSLVPLARCHTINHSHPRSKDGSHIKKEEQT
jgi:hypothetical protein